MKLITIKKMETKRLILRPFQREDAEPMFQNWASDPEVSKFLTWLPHENAEVSAEVIEAWRRAEKEPGNYNWAIELKELQEPVGSISVVKIDERTEAVTIGYCIGRKWWGQGITAEALQAVLSFFFEEAHANSVTAYHDPRNPNSGKVMRKCGMTYEGTWRARGVSNQGVYDEVWYSILREEYKNGRKPPVSIRREKEEDYRTIEELTKKAFWNVNTPGCDEHYLAHILRKHEDFIPELDFVAVTPEGKLVGNVMYTKTKLIEEHGEELPALTFGPISVHPEYQRKGISKLMLEHSFERAVKLGYAVIVIYGNPCNYVARGFQSCKKYDVRTAEGIYPSAMLVKELKSGVLAGKKWIYQESPAFQFEHAEAEKFDETFEEMEKAYQPSQEEFYIHSHSVIRG